MSSDPQTHYLNAGFDLSLRTRVRPGESARLERQIGELSVQGLLGASAGDATLLRTAVSDEFLDHLGSCGAEVPRVLLHGEVDRATRLRPFGWSVEAIELNRLHDRRVDHPPFSIIRQVNARSFALELERELFSEYACGAVITDAAALEPFLSGTSSTPEWIVKSEFGNAGLGNRRLHSPELSTTDRRFVDGLLAESGRVVLEPWFLRDRDWSVVFDVPLDPATLRIHETTYTRDGGLIGALFLPEGIEEAPWLDELADMAERVASSLEATGYFGPVCVDAFSWHDEGAVRLRPLVDLNCRRPMSDGAYRLWRQIAPDRALYFRFFNRRKLTLPDELRQAVSALGTLCYDRSQRRGVLLASPPGHAKLAVILVAEHRPGVLALESELRARFEA